MAAKQQRFVEEYLVDLNATQAAIRAGYSAKTAYSQGDRLLRHVEVAAAIRAARDKLSEKAAITAERVIEELALIGFANMADYLRVTSDGDPFIDLSTMTREQAAALTEATVEDFKEGRGEDARDVRRVKIKIGDKIAALDRIGKHLGMFRDKLDVTVKSDIADVIEKRRRQVLDGKDGHGNPD